MGFLSDMISHFAGRGLLITEVPITVRYEVPIKAIRKTSSPTGWGFFSGVINPERTVRRNWDPIRLGHN